jgi:hypothetical protein
MTTTEVVVVPPRIMSVSLVIVAAVRDDVAVAVRIT